MIPTDNIILTFDSTELPAYVTVGYVRVKVRPYVPNPMRCLHANDLDTPKHTVGLSLFAADVHRPST